ncbi:hypothetical protein [Dietzia sp.]|uniref:hypothetical protein n=1 Tax=Dietzia sp. TaxID=1871616 RepID=UPI002FDA9D75
MTTPNDGAAPGSGAAEDSPLDWRRSAQTEILLAGPPPTAADIARCLEQVLGDALTIEVMGADDPGGPAEDALVNVAYRGVAIVVSSRAEPVSADSVPEGEAYDGSISFPQDNPSFDGPLDAARGIVMWQNRATDLLRVSSRIHVAGAVYGPDENTGAVPGEDLPHDALREEIAVATITAALTAVSNTAAGSEPIGVWVPLAGLCLPAAVYRDTVVNAPLPTPVLVGLRVGIFTDDPSAPIDEANPPMTFAFTTGLFRFGRADLEFPRRRQSPPQTMGVALDVLTHELGTRSSYLPGTRIDLGDGRRFDVSGGRSRITGWTVLQIDDARD